MSNATQLRQQITEQIVAALEQNLVPWRRPWKIGRSGRHQNISTARPYSGINPLLLEMHSLRHGFSSNLWGTFKQWQALGGTVQKRPGHVEPGDWGAKIVFYSPVTKERLDDQGEQVEDKFLVQRSWTVFNLDQVNGESLDQFRTPICDDKPVEPDFEPAEQLIAATGADIRFGGSRAYYQRPFPKESWPNHTAGDFIGLPSKPSFSMLGGYYETAFHELAHWSEARLKWTGTYSLGELIAEMAACYLATELQVPHSEGLENHAAYLQSWLAEMRGDHNFIFQAATQASKVADFLTAFVRQPEPVGPGVEQ